MGIIEKTISSVLSIMSKEEKQNLMLWTVDRFLVEMTVTDKKNMMLKIMPQMLKGIDMLEIMPVIMATMMGCEKQEGSGLMGIASKMFNGGEGMETSMMVLMMMEMIPQDIKVMLPNMPKEKRIEFAHRVMNILMNEGCRDMSEEERDAFINGLMKRIGPDR